MQSIIFGYTKHKNLKNMTNLNVINSNYQNQFGGHYNCYLNNLSFEDDPIEQFLNEEAFLDRQVAPKQNQQSNDLTSIHHIQHHQNSSHIDETHPTFRKKSIFHNFQKHLITLVKKFTILPEIYNQMGQELPLKFRLWEAFKRTRSFNKKMLHMVFGISETINAEDQMRRLAQEYPQFKRLYEYSSRQDIIDAQAAIREEVIRLSRKIDRASLRQSCCVNRFEEFYQYFQSFICELQCGAMAKRMTKTRKYVVVERLKNRQKCE